MHFLDPLLDSKSPHQKDDSASLAPGSLLWTGPPSEADYDRLEAVLDADIFPQQRGLMLLAELEHLHTPGIMLRTKRRLAQLSKHQASLLRAVNSDNEATHPHAGPPLFDFRLFGLS